MISVVDISELLAALGLSSGASAEQRTMALIALKTAHGSIRRRLKYDPCYAERTEFYPGGDSAQGSRESFWEASDTHAYLRTVSLASSTQLQILHVPLRSVTSLWIDYDGRAGTQVGAFGSNTLKVQGQDFWPNYDGLDSDGAKFCRDGIIHSHGAWPSVAGSVKITYFGGYKPKELRGEDSVLDASGIWDACLDEASRRFLKMKSRARNPLAGFAGPLTSESMGDYSYTADTGLMKSLLGGTDILPENAMKLEEFQNYGSMLGM